MMESGTQLLYSNSVILFQPDMLQLQEAELLAFAEFVTEHDLEDFGGCGHEDGGDLNFVFVVTDDKDGVMLES